MSQTSEDSKCTIQNESSQPAIVFSPWQNTSILDMTIGGGDKSPEWHVVLHPDEAQSTDALESQIPPQCIQSNDDDSIANESSTFTTPLSSVVSPNESEFLDGAAPQTTQPIMRLCDYSNDETFLQNEKKAEFSPPSAVKSITTHSKVQASKTPNDSSQPAPKSGVSLFNFLSPLSSLVEAFNRRLTLVEGNTENKCSSSAVEVVTSAVLPQPTDNSLYCSQPESFKQASSNMDTPSTMHSAEGDVFLSPDRELHSPVYDYVENEISHESENTTYSSILSPSFKIPASGQTPRSLVCSPTTVHQLLESVGEDETSQLSESVSHSISRFDEVTDQCLADETSNPKWGITDMNSAQQDQSYEVSILPKPEQITLITDDNQITVPEKFRFSPAAPKTALPRLAGRRFTYVVSSLPAAKFSVPNEVTQTTKVGLKSADGSSSSLAQQCLIDTEEHSSASICISRTSGASPVIQSQGSITDSHPNQLPVTVSPAPSITSLIDDVTIEQLRLDHDQPEANDQVIRDLNSVRCRISDMHADAPVVLPVSFLNADCSGCFERDAVAAYVDSFSDANGLQHKSTHLINSNDQSSFVREPLALQTAVMNVCATLDSLTSPVLHKQISPGNEDSEQDTDTGCLPIQAAHLQSPTAIIETISNARLDQDNLVEDKENVFNTTTTLSCSPKDLHSFPSFTTYSANVDYSGEPVKLSTISGPSVVEKEDDSNTVVDVSAVRREIASLRETQSLLSSTIAAYEITLAEFRTQEGNRLTAAMQNMMQIVKERDEAMDQAATMRKALDDVVRRNNRAVDTIAVYKELSPLPFPAMRQRQSMACSNLHKYASRFEANSVKCGQVEQAYLDRLMQEVSRQEKELEANRCMLDKAQLQLKQHQCRIVHLNEQVKQQDHQREELQQMSERLFNEPSL